MNRKHDSADNFESAADPAHAPRFSEPGASDAGPGAIRGNADARGSRKTSARGNEADALYAAEPACAEEKIGEAEIEVTEEMMDAGLAALQENMIGNALTPLSRVSAVREIFRAMCMAANSHRSRVSPWQHQGPT